MGIRGLTQFLLNHLNHVGERVTFPLEKTHSSTESKNRDLLLIDGDAFIYYLYRSSGLDSWRGGVWGEFTKHSRKIVRSLTANGLDLLVCFDGVNSLKADTHEKRVEERMEVYATLWSHLDGKPRQEWADCKHPRFVLPLHAKSTLLRILQVEDHVQVRQCCGESDQELVHLFHELEPFAVLSQDSDFFTLSACSSASGKALHGLRYIPLSSIRILEAGDVKCTMYSTESVCEALNLSSLPQLALFASLVPNDYCTATMLRSFHNRLQHQAHIRNKQRCVVKKKGNNKKKKKKKHPQPSSPTSPKAKSATTMVLPADRVVSLVLNFLIETKLTVTPVRSCSGALLWALSCSSAPSNAVLSTLFGRADAPARESLMMRLQACLSHFHVAVSDELFNSFPRSLPMTLRTHLRDAVVPFMLYHAAATGHYIAPMSFVSIRYDPHPVLSEMKRRVLGLAQALFEPVLADVSNQTFAPIDPKELKAMHCVHLGDNIEPTSALDFDAKIVSQAKNGNGTPGDVMELKMRVELTRAPSKAATWLTGNRVITPVKPSALTVPSLWNREKCVVCCCANSDATRHAVSKLQHQWLDLFQLFLNC